MGVILYLYDSLNRSEMKRFVNTLLAAAMTALAYLTVFSCKKEEIILITPSIEAAVLHSYEGGLCELFLLEHTSDLTEHYNSPGSRDIKGKNWYRITLYTKDFSDNISNQDYKILNGNARSYEGISQAGDANLYSASDKEVSYGGTMTVGTNSIQLQAKMPYSKQLEIQYEGAIVKYDRIYVGK